MAEQRPLILIVEDNFLIAMEVKLLAEQCGCAVALLTVGAQHRYPSVGIRQHAQTDRYTAAADVLRHDSSPDGDPDCSFITCPIIVCPLSGGQRGHLFRILLSCAGQSPADSPRAA